MGPVLFPALGAGGRPAEGFPRCPACAFQGTCFSLKVCHAQIHILKPPPQGESTGKWDFKEMKGLELGSYKEAPGRELAAFTWEDTMSFQ